MAEVRNDRLGDRRRVLAVEQVWAQVEAGEIDRLSIREDLKTIAWSPAWPVSVRMAALKAVMSDQTEQGRADSQSMARLMIPREPEPEVTEFLSRVAAERGWRDATPSLVRSLARLQRGGLPIHRDDGARFSGGEQARPEYAAIVALNPDRSVEEVAYALFLEAEAATGPRGIVTPERIRIDAWDLLARLDVDGTRRAALIVEGDGSTPGPVADMQALLRELRTLPLTGEELRWLTLLRDFREPGRREWWAATASAVEAVDASRTGRIQMRHLEPIRWASEHRPEWVVLSREQLLDEVRQRLDGRRFHRRAQLSGERPPPSERLVDWEDELGWGDLLSILIIDDAVRQPHVIQALFVQAGQDRRDRTAEYGGLLRARGSGAMFGAVMYPPRQGDRRGDHEFVAPADMINQSAHALAHYHFHVQELRNSRYAGPSPGDLMYAARFGRSCLVFTSIGPGVLNVDYYQPDGVVIDLGTIREQWE